MKLDKPPPKFVADTATMCSLLNPNVASISPQHCASETHTWEENFHFPAVDRESTHRARLVGGAPVAPEEVPCQSRVLRLQWGFCLAQILASSPEKTPSRTLGLVPGPITPTLPPSHPQQCVTRLITEISGEEACKWRQKAEAGQSVLELGMLEPAQEEQPGFRGHGQHHPQALQPSHQNRTWYALVRSLAPHQPGLLPPNVLDIISIPWKL
ncbi:hypothetical protein J1605_020181 [Eschrichtius robustus]|uniref:Uncharacterized protein n=1 Tax=Eschrichtius robustus TaxID=9764 RepID=A0AB34HGN8_ESCRO|nr:hypothetical protein J1605_020181 [Eschrichtius robustus]